MSLSEDSARPLGLNAAVCGTWTLTVSPEDVLALLLSGATLISGGNLSFEQPVSDTGVPAELCVTVLAFTHWPGFSHESALSSSAAGRGSRSAASGRVCCGPFLFVFAFAGEAASLHPKSSY